MNLLKSLVFLILTLIASSCAKSELSEIKDSDEIESSSQLAPVYVSLEVRAAQIREANTSRLLESEENRQHVVDMRIYVFRSQTGDTDDSFKLYKPTVNGKQESYIPVTDFFKTEIWKADEFESHRCELKPKLPSGYYYRFLAVGIDDSDNSGTAYTNINWDETTSWSTVHIENSTANSTTPNSRVNEIFTGIAIEEDGKSAKTFHTVSGSNFFSATIELTRSVAGVLLCVKNVPSQVEADFNISYTETNGSSQSSNNMIIEKAKAYPLSSLKVISIGWNKRLDALSQDNLLESDRILSLNPIIDLDILRNATDTDKDEAGTYRKNFPIAGTFLYPVKLYDKENITLENYMANLSLNTLLPEGLSIDYTDFDQLRHKRKTTQTQETCPLPCSLYLIFFTEIGGQEYPVKFKAIRTVQSYDSTGPITEEHDEDNMNGFHYNLYANHIYSIGTQTNPIDLEESLKKSDEIILVSGNWQADITVEM